MAACENGQVVDSSDTVTSLISSSEIGSSEISSIDSSSETSIFTSSQISSYTVASDNTSSSGISNIFSTLHGLYFYFLSGAGGWSTIITIASDGSFFGNYRRHYLQNESTDTGSNYQIGADFNYIFMGKFTNVVQIDNYTYLMTLDTSTDPQTSSQETTSIISGTRVITSYGPASDAYGFDGAGTFMLYLPGRSTVDLPAGFIGWMKMNPNYSPNLGKTLPSTLPCYGLYNVNGQMGFFSENSNTIPLVS